MMLKRIELKNLTLNNTCQSPRLKVPLLLPRALKFQQNAINELAMFSGVARYLYTVRY